ncbi:acetyltransferase (GNAT) family protein [Leucobacter komagatae]|uniref:Acetyltransferase (GNAT) family protein n=1 Tax=Leucobacter komagatae TaxID=55969 RepID=A0A542Y2S8_9MICO|nr:N-acetyltransferase [Leucobacter komagatae]TQL42380.1 acetyltransferase (GNAT) family protein [Leucobacter komagatae]
MTEPSIRSPAEPTVIRTGVAPDDVEWCARLWADALAARDGSVDRPVMQQRVRDAFAAPIVRFAIATSPGAGFSLLEREAGEPAKALLHYLAVDPRNAVPGVGSALLRDAIEHARAAALASVSLEVRTNNARAISLYERHGFVASGSPTPHPTAGYPMQRYVLSLAKGPAVQPSGGG